MEKYHYLSIISRSEFTDLFKFGHLFVNYSLTFDGNIYLHKNDVRLFRLLTCRLNVFEYSFEYLIIHILTEKYKGTSFVIDIDEVQGIYTFDDEAKREMMISFNPKIQLQVSPWSEKFYTLQKDLHLNQSLRGIDSLWKVFELSESLKNECKRKVGLEVFQEVFDELYSNQKPSGDLSLWVYLLRYERHSLYPLDMKGFFCDFIHVVCNWTKKTSFIEDVAKGTKIYPEIIKSESLNFEGLSSIIANSPLTGITFRETNCRFDIVGPLFLYMKSLYKDGMNKQPDRKFIDKAKKMGEFEFSLAVYLLGFTLGFDKTYDVFYEKIDLPFFNKTETKDCRNSVLESSSAYLTEQTQTYLFDESEVVAGKKGQNSEVGDILPLKDEINTAFTGVQEQYTSNVQPDLFGGETLSQAQQQNPICWMRRKKGDLRPAFSEEDVNHFQNQCGYKKVKKLTTADKELIRNKGFKI